MPLFVAPTMCRQQQRLPILWRVYAKPLEVDECKGRELDTDGCCGVVGFAGVSVAADPKPKTVEESTDGGATQSASVRPSRSCLA